MSYPTPIPPGRRHSCPLVRFLGLATMLLLAVGCDSSNVNQQQIAAAQEDPEGEFDWGMKRLERALRLFGPSSADGFRTKEDLQYEIFPPDDTKPNYTARVTVKTETTFLHGKSLLRQKEKTKPEQDKRPLIDDPLADQSDKDLAKYIDIPGAGPQAPIVAATRIKERSVENVSVFELAYVNGQWELTQQPELKHEQLRFEYAFNH